MMQPVHLGTANRRLFGVYHPAHGRSAKPNAVVLCPPLGQEAIRCHRAFFVLAQLLAREGVPVLRFDYFGTGDSHGTTRDGNLTQWCADVQTAMEEVRGRSGKSEVTLIGLRLGGALAVRTAATCADVTGLILWDPVIHGGDYWSETRREYQAWLDGSFAKAGSQTDETEVSGFCFGQNLVDEICAIDLLQEHWSVTRPVLLCTTGDEAPAEPSLQALQRKLRDRGVSLDEQTAEGTRVWVKSEDANLSQTLVPRPTLQRFSEWISTKSTRR